MDTAHESDAEVLWDEVTERLDEACLPAAAVAMVQSCEATSFDGSELKVRTASRFVQRSLARHMDALSEVASAVAFSPVRVSVEVAEGARRPASARVSPEGASEGAGEGTQAVPRQRAAVEPKAGAAHRSNPLVEDVTSVDSLLTFERFIEGPQNKFALDAAKQVANGNHNYNPLFIYGKSGLGKTHLLRAIQNYLVRNDPDRVCVYRVATDFIDDYSKAMKNARSGAAEALAENYHSIDVLIIDDVQLMSSAAGTIGFFYDTFNYLVRNGKQIVLAADRTPSQLGMGQSHFDERVTSRLDSGMTVSVQAPDYELKLQLIEAFYDRMRQDAREQHVPGIDAEIPEDLRKLMAEIAGTNIRVIEGFVQSCLMHAYQRSSVGARVDEADIRNIAAQKWSTGQGRITCEQIQDAVEGTYNISHEDLIGARRSKELMEPRQIAIWLTRELTGDTLADIGKKFGGRTHATVKYSIGVIEKAAEGDPGLRERIDAIRDSLVDA